MKFVVLIFLFGMVCPAEQTGKPACNSKNQGQFWPEEANSNHAAARLLYQRGELEMCSLAVWKYRWEHLSVNARIAAKDGHALTPGAQKAEIKESN